MERKYQFFISSTYEDLKIEREKAIYTILEMEQFPIGMELFSAADEDQWSVISQTIENSDYYVLIIGRRYGSIISGAGLDSGISYTEKELNYAMIKNIPVLAFIMDDDAAKSISSREKPEKVAKLEAFKNKVKDGRYVKFFNNPDQFSTYLLQSIHKALRRGDRPGWIRAPEFDIEESHARILQLTERIHTLEALNADLQNETNRKPNLVINYRRDPECEDENGNPIGNEPEIVDGIIHYKARSIYIDDVNGSITYIKYGRKVTISKDIVRICRTFFMNGFSLLFTVNNIGNARATGVRVHLELPEVLLAVSNTEIYDYIQGFSIGLDKKAANEKSRIINVPIGFENISGKGDFLSKEELISNSELANLLDSGDVDISLNSVNFEFSEVRHKDLQWYKGVYFYPTQSGKFDIKCSLMCNELPEAINQTIKLVVE